MKLENIVIGVIIVSLVVTGSTLFLSDLTANYGVSYNNDTLNNTLYQTQEYLNESQQLSEKITDIELGEGAIDLIETPYELIKVGWSVMKTVFESWGTVSAMVKDIGQSLSEGPLGIPTVLFSAAITIFVIILVFVLVYGFFKWRFNNEYR